MVEVKAGQWWTDKGSVAERHRILVRGLTSGGKRVICEASDERVYTLDLEYFFKYKEHLPECTSFEWVPEVYPQYRVSFQPEKFAFVRLNDKHTFTYVRLDGKEDPPCGYGYAWGTINERTKFTEAEALARIVKPEPKVEYPIYWTTMNPDEYAYLEQVDAENVRTVRKDGTPNRPGKASHREYAQRTRLTEEQAEALIQKPKPKIRTVKVHTVAYGLDKLKFVSKVLDTELDGVKRDWHVVTILKTEEFEVPCE